MIQTLGLIAGATLSLFNPNSTNPTLTSHKIGPQPALEYHISSFDTSSHFADSLAFGSIYSDSSIDLFLETSGSSKEKKDTLKQNKPQNSPTPTPAPQIELSSPSPQVKSDTPQIKIHKTESKQDQQESFGYNQPLDPNVLLDLVNQYRAQLGMVEYQTHPDLCELADSRAPELHDEIFRGVGLHAGLRRRQLDYYVTENMIHQPTEQAALNWWLSSGLHRRAIESGTFTHSCGACQGNSCALLFTNFTPK